MNAAEVLENVTGLTIDNLARLVRVGLIRPKGGQWHSLGDAEFSNRDLFIIKRTWYHMKELRREEGAAK